MARRLARWSSRLTSWATGFRPSGANPIHSRRFPRPALPVTLDAGGSAMPRRLVLVILAVIVVPVAAQTPRAAEADSRFALREAQRLALTDPPRALDRLQRLLSSLETDGTLPTD